MQFIGPKRCQFTTLGVNRSKTLLNGVASCRRGNEFDEAIDDGNGEVAAIAADRQHVKPR
jgi:hypothetical protein